VDIEFDPDKDVINQAKHGVSLALAADLDWDLALVWVDSRYEYDEVRMIGLTPNSFDLFTVVFVDIELDDDAFVRRIISLRYADREERTYYRENFD
jgi:uncharacterized DUF497 family protein